MAIDLKKNERALLAAYNDVLSDRTDTNWAVFGYQGNSNELKVVETGDSGIEELTEEMNGGKVLYAFLRVTDPNTQLPKNVLINWLGEGVPPTRKGVCSRHVNDVARLFRGAHVTINARSEMDLDEDTILDKVAKASGANFSFHKEQRRAIPEQGPVGSVYKKANPQAEINVRARDDFWNKQERDEEQRRAQERREAAEIRRKEELERREREKREGEMRDRAAKERFRAIDEQKRQEAEAQKREREATEAQLQSRLKAREQEVEAERQREREAQQRRRVQDHMAISSAVQQTKAGFEQPEAAPEQPPPMRPAKKPPKQPPRLPEPEPEPEPQWEPEPEPEPQWEPEPEPEPQWEPEPEPEPQWEPEPEPEPEQPLYDDVEREQSPEPEPEEPHYDLATRYEEEEEPQQPVYDEAVGEDEGLTATTVYDYDATDETEISFDVDEIITNIEQIDEGWWRGVRKLDGSYGLFPANYVELN